MVRPLTKCSKDGMRYTRPQAVESVIEGALRDDLPTLKRRLSITDKGSPDYLPSECLVHLIRDARCRNDDQSLNAVLPILFGRCEAILRAKVSDQLPNADLLRDDVLSEFSELLASDRTGKHPDELDFYECKFNLAFRTLWINVVRREMDQIKQATQLPDHEDKRDPDAYEDVFARVSEAVKVSADQQDQVFREELWKAIEELPPDQRDAVVLCHVLGYKIESDDPSEVTAATRCQCTGRTIRNRLKRAAKKLAKLKEIP